MADDTPRYETKAAYAAAMVRRSVSEGKYAPGDRLQVAKLAKEFGLSLTPVREALFELASEGIINMSPHRGARVADVSISDLTEVYQLREVLESLASRLAAERVTHDKATALAAIHKRFVAASKAGEYDLLRPISDEFHGLIFEIAHSSMLSDLIRRVWAAAPADTFTVVKDRIQHSINHHATILEAIRFGDAPSAEKIMREHIRDSLELISKTKAEGTCELVKG